MQNENTKLPIQQDEPKSKEVLISQELCSDSESSTSFQIKKIFWDRVVSPKFIGVMMQKMVHLRNIKDRVQVAIKVIQKTILTQDLKSLIDSQIRILRLIHHPNIVKCYQILDDQKNIYIIMELCQQGDLESKIDLNGPLSEAQALPIIKGVFQGLVYLSQIDLIHRDIKAANIFIHKKNPKIADFGFALHNRTKKQFQDISIGSPIYMSPEGIKHNVYGPKTDVWAFGIFIYEILHGKTPYSHCTKQKELKYNISNPINWSSFKAQLSYSIKEIMLKCLEVNYEKRITFQKLKQLDFFKQFKADDKTIQKVKVGISSTIPSKAQKYQKKQSLLSTPAFKRLQRTQCKQLYQQYFEKLQNQISAELSLRKNPGKMADTFQWKLKNQLEGKVALNKNFFRLLSPSNLQRCRSKSRQTPKTREQAVSAEQKQNIKQITKKEQMIGYMLKQARNKNNPKKPLNRLKSEPNQLQLLTQYKEYQRNGYSEVHKSHKTQINEGDYFIVQNIGRINPQQKRINRMGQAHNNDDQFSFVDKFNSHQKNNFQRDLTRQIRNGYKPNNRYKAQLKLKKSQMKFPKNYHLQSYDFQQDKLFQNLFRKPKKNYSLRQNLTHVTHQRYPHPDSGSGSGSRRMLNQNLYTLKSQKAIPSNIIPIKQTLMSCEFPRQNINCYLYLLHFSRLLYKLSCNLQTIPYLTEIRQFISIFCLETLSTVIRIAQSSKKEFIKSRKQYQNTAFSRNLTQIQQTAHKYLAQYESQLGVRYRFDEFSVEVVNSKLEGQINVILSKQVKSHNDRSAQLTRLLYLSWVYLQHYREIFGKYFMKQSGSKYWLEYNSLHIVKYIQKDIQFSNIAMNMETYLTTKKKLQERNY